MKKKQPCSGKCSSKVKANNYNKNTNERALLLTKSQTKSLQLNWKRTPDGYFHPKNTVQILSNSSSGCLFNKNIESCIGSFDKENIE